MSIPPDILKDLQKERGIDPIGEHAFKDPIHGLDV